MKIPTSVLRLKGLRFPREIIACAVWAYHRFAMSTADVEDLLAERGVIVSREAIRLWVNRFGPHFANCVRRDRPRPNDKWHLDEVVISIRVRIPEHAPTHSDNMRPLVPGYSPTCDALP
jgi:putative transposase